MSKPGKKPAPSIVTPTDRELVRWLIWQAMEKLLRLALLAGLIYAGWWWWVHRNV